MRRKRFTLVLLVLVVAVAFVSACEKKENAKGKLIVSEQSFFMRQDSDNAYVIDGRGKIRNVGDYDVRRVMVTANCLSCREEMIVGRWFVSDIEKTDAQRDTINYIAAGDEEEFSVKDVAFIYNTVAEAPENIPEEFEVLIESFETVTN